MKRLALLALLAPALAFGQGITGRQSPLRFDASGNLVTTQVYDSAKRPTYVACSAAEANTATAEALVIEAGASKATRIRAIWINPGLQTSAAYRSLTILRRTTASSSGTTITPNPVDAADAAFSGVVRSKPTAGSAGATLFTYQMWVPTAVANSTVVVWPPPQVQPGVIKDLVIPAGTANGIGISDPGASGGASLMICAALTEE